MATETEKPSYDKPEADCDLVMKGGITSGLVYPPAIQELAKKYRIRNIGGTSAGAVAAALAASAEYARESGGFTRLGKVAEQLKGGTFLRDLFQGSKETEPLLKVLVKAPDYKEDLQSLVARARKQGLARCVVPLIGWLNEVFNDGGISTRAGKVKGLLWGVAVALVFGALIWVLGALFGGATAALFAYPSLVLVLVCGVTGYLLGGLAAGAGTLYDIVATKIPENNFGICSGVRDKDNPEYKQIAATEWLLKSVQDIAGRHKSQEYLTFGELLGKAEHKMDLRFMTTDISAGRPYVLPFADDEWFIFSKAQLSKLFPEPVVEYLVAQSVVVQKKREKDGLVLPRGYHFLPPKEKWPIAFAARLSMSFPYLFSSVPLYRLPRNVERWFIDKPGNKPAARHAARENEESSDATRENKELLRALERDGHFFAGKPTALKCTDLVIHWFSDGGIASNFPIQFFDAWLPNRPTLGITLRYVPSETAERGDDDPQRRMARQEYWNSLGERSDAITGPGGEAGDVWLPMANDSVPEEWQPIYDPRVPSAIPTLGNAFQFIWSIVLTMQNYRDNMQTALASYRERVVQVRLNPDEGGLNLGMSGDEIQGVVDKGVRAGTLLKDYFILPYHKWARLRMLVSRIEDAFRAMDPQSMPTELRQLIEDQRKPGSNFPFPKPEAEWCAELERRADALLELAGEWKGKPLEDFKSESSLRVTPEP